MPENYNYEVALLVMAKKAKLTFEELNELTMNDFMDFIDIFVGEDEEVEREATQEDIDRFYSMM